MNAIPPSASSASSRSSGMTLQEAAQLATDNATLLQAKEDVKYDLAKQARDTKLNLKALLAMDAVALKQAQDDQTRAQAKLDRDEAAVQSNQKDAASGVAKRIQKELSAPPSTPAVDVTT